MIDLSDDGNFLLYELQSRDGNTIKLRSVEDDKAETEHKEASLCGELAKNPAIISKNTEELITESVWWIRPGN